MTDNGVLTNNKQAHNPTEKQTKKKQSINNTVLPGTRVPGTVLLYLRSV